MGRFFSTAAITDDSAVGGQIIHGALYLNKVMKLFPPRYLVEIGELGLYLIGQNY